MSTTLTLDEIAGLLQRRGAAQYGLEAVSQLDHALQCAQLAEQAGETPATVVAALLHDLGHLLAAERLQVAEPDHRRDDLHQYIALPFLRPLFGEDVLAPIRLHVDAKRYLCQAEPGYFETLSPASVNSLALQGGPYNEQEARAFLHQPFAGEAVRLRRYDDQAKVAGQPTPGLAHYLPLLQQVAAAAA